MKIADSIQFKLSSLKQIMESYKIGSWIIQFKKPSRLRVKPTI